MTSVPSHWFLIYGIFISWFDLEHSVVVDWTGLCTVCTWNWRGQIGCNGDGCRLLRWAFLLKSLIIFAITASHNVVNTKGLRAFERVFSRNKRRCFDPTEYYSFLRLTAYTTFNDWPRVVHRLGGPYRDGRCELTVFACRTNTEESF